MAVSVNLAKLNRASVRTNANEKTSAPKLAAKTTNVTAAASANVSRTGSANNIRFQATQALGSSQRMHTFSRNAAYSDSPFVSGFRNPTPNDFVMRNVGLNIGASTENGFSLTPRGQRREVGRYFDMLAKLNQHQCQGNTGADKVSTMAMLNQLGQIAGTVAKEITSASKTSSTSSASSVANTVAQELKNAKTSAEIEQALNKLDGEQATLDREIKGLKDTITKETGAIETAEKGIDTANAQITSENQNIQKQEGQILKLESNITMNEATLKSLQAKLATASDMQKAGIQSQINSLQDTINQQKDAKKAAEESRDASKDKIEKELKPAKENHTKALENAKKNLSKAQSDLEVKQEQQEKLQKTEDKYTAKLDKKEGKEETKLRKMHSELAQIARDYQAETDAVKKDELNDEYKKLVADYNSLVGSSSTDNYSQLATSLS